jgi:hypothetical protein
MYMAPNGAHDDYHSRLYGADGASDQRQRLGDRQLHTSGAKCGVSVEKMTLSSLPQVDQRARI